MDTIKSPHSFDLVQFFWTQWKQSKIVEKLTPHQIYAKIEGNSLLTNKHNLLNTMTKFYIDERKGDPFQILPVTYNITASKNLGGDPTFLELSTYHCEPGTWICKPGENANRGKGIVVMPNLAAVKNFLQSSQVHWGDKWVVQKYIDKPLLIGGKFWNNSPMRKFDIRMFALAQIVDGVHYRGYFFKEGYVRTSSLEFDMTDLTDRDVHLTNDAVQLHASEYGRWE